MNTELNQLQQLPDYQICLRGIDLWCKHGFEDGDILDDYLFDVPSLEALWYRAWKEKDTTTFCSFSLMALVELYLLPKFDRPMTVRFSSYSHNGVRAAEDEWWDANSWPGPVLPEIELAGAEILPIMFGMSKAFNAWLDGATCLEFPPQLAQTAREMTKELGVTILTTGLPFSISPLELK